MEKLEQYRQAIRESFSRTPSTNRHVAMSKLKSFSTKLTITTNSCTPVGMAHIAFMAAFFIWIFGMKRFGFNMTERKTESPMSC